MAVKIRLTRMGRRHRPFFRINAVEARTPRDGKILEKLGHYDPLKKDPAKQVVLNRKKIQHWLDKGAIPSDTVSQILLRQGIKHKYADKKTKRRALAKARIQGKSSTTTEKITPQRPQDAAAKDLEDKPQEISQEPEKKNSDEN